MRHRHHARNGQDASTALHRCSPAISQLIEHDIPPILVVFHDQSDIMQTVLKNAVLIVAQAFLLVIINRSREITYHFYKTFLRSKQLHGIKSHGKLAHLMVGCLIVQNAEFVYVYDIKSVAEFQVCQAFCMMQVFELITSLISTPAIPCVVMRCQQFSLSGGLYTSLRTGQPVHVLIRLIETLVKIVDANHLSDISSDHYEFFRHHIPCHWHNDPKLI